MRQVAILGALLTAALIGSYVAWTDQGADTTQGEKVLVYRAALDDVERLTWASEGNTAVLERRTDAKGAYIWITLTETVTPEVDPDTGEGTDTDEEAPAPEVKTVSFKGNEAADKLWGEFAPLYALRELMPEGDVSDAAFGFTTPTATLEVQRRSGPLTLVLGGETYGAKDRYAKLDGRILLLDDKSLRPLQFARTRLVDRLLQPLDERSADRIEVSAFGRTASFVHKNKDDRAAAFWTAASNPTAEDTAAATWIGKLMRMRVQDYDVPSDASGLESVFAFTVHGGKDAWAVQILRDEGPEGVQYYARTDYARGLVHLTESLASEAIADLDTVLPTE